MVDFIGSIVKKIIIEIITVSLQKVLPSKLSDSSKGEIINKLLEQPKIKYKIENLIEQIVHQMHLSTVMVINALIGLVPVPIVPGIIRTIINAIFLSIKGYRKYSKFKHIVDESKEFFDSNPEIKELLGSKGKTMLNKLDNSTVKSAMDKVEQTINNKPEQFLPNNTSMKSAADTLQQYANNTKIASNINSSITQNNNPQKLLQKNIQSNLPNKIPNITPIIKGSKAFSKVRAPSKSVKKGGAKKSKKYKSKKYKSKKYKSKKYNRIK